MLTGIAISLVACAYTDDGAGADSTSGTLAAPAQAESSPPPREALEAPAPPALRALTTLGAPHWTRGGDETDLAFRAPSALAADSTLVYVLDYATNAVTALDAASGRERWTTASATPAILNAPLAMAARFGGGGVTVADVGAQRMVQLAARDGRIEGTSPLAADAHPIGICPRPDGSALIADPTAGAHVATLPPGPTSVRVGTIRFPWTALRDASPLVTQAWLAPVADGSTCALALVAGEGLALLDDHGFRWRQRYIERSPLPTPRTSTVIRGDTTTTRSSLATTTLAANALGAVGPYIAVAFEGQSPARSRLIDLYVAHDGRYAYSLETDAPVRAVAGNRDGLLVLATRRAGRPMIAAYTLPPAPDRAPAGPR